MRGPVISDMRLSRLRYPRGTALAMALLALVFVVFGVFANALEVGNLSPAPNTVDGAARLIGHWMLS